MSDADDRRERGRRTRERRGDEDEEGGWRLGFSLPPIRLPPLFPDSLRVVLPAPGVGPIRVSGRAVLFGALVFDLVDAALALWGADGVLVWVRGVAGVVLGVVVAGPVGLVAAWEPLAAAAGYGVLAVVPTLTLLALGVRR